MEYTYIPKGVCARKITFEIKQYLMGEKGVKFEMIRHFRYASVGFYAQKAKEAGINPLIGCEFYVHNGSISEKDPNNNPCYHLILLAKDKDGYKNLVKLMAFALATVSLASFEGINPE